jgi:hypothetical protein
VDLRVLPRGVLDGTAQFSALSKYLVPNGRQVLRKGVKLGGSATLVIKSISSSRIIKTSLIKASIAWDYPCCPIHNKQL